MHSLDLILTLTGGLVAALALGYTTHRLGLSPIVGYLLAGIAVGPHTPGFVANRELSEQLAEVGVILLMFGVGINFHLKELLAVRRVAVPGAVVQSLVATVLGALTMHTLGWGWTAGIVFGLAISVASTVVLVRVLADNRDLHTPAGHVAVGWLVVEDLFTVIVLVLLPALFGPAQAGASSLPVAIAVAGAKIAALVALTFLAGGRVIPWLLGHVAMTRSRELFTLTVLVLALGIAVASAKVFGVSMPLGAFLAGMIVGRSDFSSRAASEALPMRDAFAVLFFVSVGMLFNPGHLLESPGVVAATLGIILVGKPVAAFAIVWLLRYPPRTGLAVAVALAQIGEFSFLLALLAQQLEILPDTAAQTIVAAAIISITLNPLLYQLVDPLEKWAAAHPRLWAFLTSRLEGKAPAAAGSSPEESGAAARHRAIIVGYGPVGRTVARLLRQNDIEPVVIELNLDTLRALRAEGVTAIYGDARHRETLKEAHAESAQSLILSASGLEDSEEIIRLARELNPKIQVLARAAYVRELPALRRAGAASVFSGEGEVALAMTVEMLRRLGATPDQIDRERERVQAELAAEPATASVPRPEEAPAGTEAAGT
jgi:CPA2 family monovalent cation:H+ antiporter-2